MKIGVISDTHGYPDKWLKALNELFFDTDLIIHAGDVLYHGPRNPILEGYNPKVLAEMINECHIPLLIAKGNCDCDVDQMVLDWPILSPYSFFQNNNIRIMTVHGYKEDQNQLIEMAKKFKANIVITGHTHVKVLEKIEDIIFLNPGSPSIPKGDGIPSVAKIENNTISIYNLESKQILSSLTL